MSRIGQAPIPVPSDVEVHIDMGTITVRGPRGELVTRATEQREVKALHGLIRSLVANMVQGVTQGYEKALEIQGVGYRAAKKGNDLEVQVGYSHSVSKPAPEGIEFDVPTAIRKPEPYKGKGIRYEGERVRRKAGKAAKAAG